MFRRHKTVHIIHSQLPNVNSDSATWEVTLPTIHLPDDARKIMSSIPFTAFNHLGIPGDPYLPCYQYHLERYNCEHNPFSTPPLQTCFTQGVTPTPNLSLLAEVCKIWRQLAHLKEEREASERDEERTHKVLPSLITPIFRLTPAKPPQEPPSRFTLLAPNRIGG